MGQSSICGFAVEWKCETIAIKEITAFDFQTNFIAMFDKILEEIEQPKIKMTLFERAGEGTPNNLVIVPQGFANLHLKESARTVTLTFDAYVGEQVAIKAYAQVLTLIRITLSIIDSLSKRLGFIYQANLATVSSSQVRLTLTITRTM